MSALAPALRNAAHGTHRRVGSLLLLAGLTALLLASLRPAAPAAGPAPAFLRHAVGTAAAAHGALPSTSFGAARSSVTRRGVGVSAPWARLALVSRDAGDAPWHRYAKGAARPTSFGSETVTLSGLGAEEYLTVRRHLGLHTWRWTIDSTLHPHLRVDGTIGFTNARGKTVLLTIGKPAVLDGRGRPLPAAGLRWGLDHRVLTLRLDDAALPTPYTIDPSISLSAAAFTAVKGSGQNGSFALTIPAGAASGDLLVVQVVTRTNAAVTVPTAVPAWTLLSSQVSGTTLAQYMYVRTMSATDIAGTTSYTWTIPSGTDAAGGMVALRNVDAAPTNPSQQSQTASGSTSPATLATALTTDASSVIGANNDYVMAFYGGSGNFTFAETNASLTGLWGTAANQIPNGSGQLNTNTVSSGSSGASRAESLVSAGQIGAGTAINPSATLSAANSWILNALAFRVAVPYDQTVPTISGTVAVGQTLTAATGTWSNTPTGYTYQWLRCDASGANCVSIGGATSSTYVLTSADAGSTIRVQVTASNALGSGQPAQSAQTAALPAPDGSGTMTTPTSNVTAGSTGNTLTFTYTAASGGLSAGKVQLTVPAGWTAPSTTGANAGYTTASTGTVGVSGQVITVSNVTLASGATMTITYGSKASGGAGATAATTAGSQTWSTAEASTSGATPAAIASSPSVTIDPAAASKLAWSQQPSNTAGGATISPSPTVTVQDQYGNTVTSSSASIAVAIGTNPASGTLSGTTAVSASSGVATFSNLSLDKAGTGYTLTASSTGLTGATSSSFNVTVGAAAKLAFSQQPTTATAGSSISPAVTVRVQDAGGNTVTTSSASITIAIGTNPGGGTLSGTATASAASGVATFSNLSIDKSGTGYTLTASSTGLTGATSSSFNINAGAASKLVFTQQPTSATAGSSISPAVTVAVQDALGNTVTSSSASISMAIGTNPGGGTLSGTTPVSASSGVATFSNLSINKGGTGYTLNASATGLTGATSSSFNINVGAVDASQSTVSASPGSVTADGSATSTITVTAKDAFGNVVSGQSVSLAQGGGSSTITTVTGTTNASGQATFTVKDTLAQTVTYTATIGATTVLQTASVTFTPGAATHLAVTAPASSTAGSAFSVTVTAYDANNNVATGYAGTVHFTSSDGQAVLPANYTFVPGTDAGAHTFTSGVTLKTAGSKSVTATDTVTGTITGSASVTVGAAGASAAVSTVTASPTSVVADNSTTSTVTATLTDAYGNALSGKSMMLTAGSGSSTITTGSGTTNASGQASWTVKDANVENVTYTAKDTTDTVTITQTAAVAFTTGPVTAAQSTVSASPGSVTADGSTTSTVTVTLKDAQSHPVSGKTVTLAKSGGSSTITTVSGTTNASGQATFTVKDTVAETTTYTATDSTDSLTVTQTAAVTFTPGSVSASQSTVSAAPGSVTADGSTTSTITVTLKDANGNAVSGKTVTLGKSGGSSTITTVSGTTNASGQATFTVKDTAAETTTYTATDSTDSVTVTQTASVTFTAGAVSTTQSTVSSAPGSVTADGSTTSTITVTAKDAFGNPVPSQSVSLSQGAGASTVTTVSGTTNASGQATFTVKDTTAETVTYTATIGASTILATASVTFTPGPATHLSVGAPASATAGSAVSVTVTALDAHNNTATAYAGTVHFTSSDGRAVLPANYTFVPGTDAGAHTFSVTLKTAGSKSVTATDTVTGSITGATSVTVSAAGASAAVSTVGAAPGSVVADGSTSSTVTATITDAYGNPLAGKTVTLAKGGGSSTITTVSGTTNASGQATFTVKDTVAETTTYTATDSTDSVTVTQTAPVTFTPGVPTAANSTVSASPASVLADGSTTSTVTVTLKDANGNAVPGKTVSLAAGSGSSTITTVTGTTDASGRASFTVKDAAVESVTYTATDTSDGVTVTQTAAVAFTLGAVSASQSTVSASPASVTADGAATSTITVTLRDAQSHPVPAKTVSLAAGSGSSTITTVSATTNASGQATFTVKDSVAEGVTYTATDTTDSVTVSQTAGVTFAPGPVAAAQSTVTASPTSVVADGSATSTVTVTLKDAHSNPVSGKTVTLAKSGGSSTITTVSGTTNASGQATFTVKDTVAETTTYTATDSTDSVTVTQTASVTFTSGAVSAAQSTVSASPASVTADGSTASTITVTLKDTLSNPVSGKTVTLAKSGGSSTITTVSATTNGSGQATFTVVDAAVESTTYTATDSTDSVTVTQTATVSFTAGAVDATASTVSAAPGSVTADGSTTSTVTVTAKDAFGHPLSGQSVSLGQGGGSSTVTTVSGTTNASGQASFTVKDTHAELVTYTATIGATTVLQTATVTFTPGAATHLVVSAPASATAGSAFSVTVTAYDANNNVAGGYAGTIHFASGDGQAVLPANYTFVPGSDAGVHTFTSGVTLKTAGSKSVTATDTVSGTITGSSSVTVSAASASAAASTLSASPSSVVADNATTSTVTATLTDAYGNPLAGKTITLGAGSGSSTIATVSGTTNASGHATFTVRDANVESVTYTATDATDSTTITQTATVAFTTGPVTAAQSTVGASPASVTADGTTTSTITVTLKDAQSHAVAGKTVTLAAGSGSSTITTVSGTTNASGQATFTVKDTVAEGVTYTATDATDSVTVAQTAGVTFTPGAVTAAQSTVSATPTSITADGSATSTVTVTLEDANGNPVAGKTVSLAGSPSGSTITPVSGTTNAAGRATFAVSSTVAGPVVYTATDATDSVTVSQSATVTFDAGAVDAAQSTVTASPGSVTADGATTSTITVTAKDAFGNAVAGQSAALGATGGSSTITTVTGTTDASGRATFTVKDTTAETVTYTATIGATSVLQTASVAFTPGAVTHFALSLPGASTAGAALSATVTALDVHGNVVTGYAGTVHFGSGDPQASLPADYTFVPATDHGTHVFTNGVTLKTAGSEPVTAADGGASGSASVTVSAAAASASHSTVTASPASVPADGSATSTVTVTITDAYDNPLAGKTVTLAGAPTTSTISTVSGTTDGSGRATFTVRSTTANTVTYTATDVSDSLTVTQTASVGFATMTPDAATSSVVASPSTVEADGATASTITVTVRDANANAIAGKLVSLAKSGGSSTITAISATTDAAGRATFSVQDAAVESTTYTASVPANSVTVTQTAAVAFVPGAVSASHSAVSASPASVTADGASSATVSVTLRDRSDHALAGVGVTLAAGSGSSSITPASATTNASGVATFSVTDTTAETVSYTATAGATTVTQTASVTFTPGAANAGQTTITIAPASLTAGGSTTVTVHARDAAGNPLSTGGATVVLATDHGTLSAVTDNGDGTYTATLSWTGAGTAHVTGTLGGTAIGHPASAAFGPGAADAAQTTITASPGSITADGSSTTTVTVHARDAYGNALATGGATVALSTDRGTVGSVTDNGDGTYTATLTAPTTTGQAHVTGTLGGTAIGHPASVALVPGPADAARSTISATPGSITADGAATATVTVHAKDVNGNALTTGGATVALSTDRGTLGSVTDNGDGTYTATLTAPTTTGTAHVTGTLGGVAIGGSAAVSLVPGAPSGAHSSISAAPSTLTADGAATSALTVHLRDANGNAVATGGAAVVLTADAGSVGSVADNGDGTYSATFTAPTATGTAHVTGTVNGQAIATAAAISLVPGAVSASHSSVGASSATASTDTPNAATVTVTVTDAHGNPIQGSHVVLTQGATAASIAPNPLAGADTDAAGKAVFTIGDTVAETAVFSATAGGTLLDQTASVQFQPGAAAQLVYGQQPANTTAGATLAPSPTVRILDAHGNLTSSTAAVSIAVKSGTGAAGAALAGTTTRSAAGGIATFDDLSIAKAGSGYVLSAAASGLTGADSGSFDVATGPASAAHTTITASPASINADGTSGTSTVTVHVRDAFDNALATGGATVALATSRGSLSGVTDNGDGTYTATLTATGQSGTASVTGTLGGAAIGHPTSVTLVPPVPVAAIDSGVASSPTSATGATFAFHSPNDDGNTTFECSLDGAAFAACTSPKTYSGLADGSHTFRVHGVNANGAGANVSQSWTVDTTGPVTTLTTAPGAYTNNSTEPLAASATDATTSVAAVDFRYAATAAACPTGTLISTDTTAPYTATWTLPADGSYVVCAVATDAVGNAGAAATASVVVDQTKPSVSLSAFGKVVGATTYVRGTPSLHASASDATSGVGSVDFSFAGAASGAVAHLTSTPYDATWDTTGLADGSYTVTAAATDRAGNADTSSRSVTVDNTAPTASLDDPGAYGHGTIPLSVTASDTGSGIDTAATLVQSSPHGANTWTTIAAPATWTPADGDYDLRAVVEDEVGNQTITATRTILVDNTPPTVSDDGDGNWHNTDVTLTLTAADAESGVASVEYKVDGGSWSSGTTVSVPTSLGDGSHTVTYRATNRAGVTSAQQTATVKLDSTPPTVSDPTVTPSSAFVHGSVDLASTVSDGTGSGIASTTYRLAPAGTPETTPASACATWGSAIPPHFDTKTVADGTYALRTVAVDNALNGRCSNVATATTLEVDNTAPTTSDDAPFGAQNADVPVHLTASDNLSGVAATEYSVDGGPWTAGTSVTVAAPASHANDGVHTIAYRSTDNAGNVESTKTTQVTIDTTAPSGSGVDPASLLSGTVTLDASPSESDIASVEWLYRPAGSSGAWTSIGTDHAAPWQMPWITTGISDGSYDLEAVFTDTTGNSTTQAFSPKTIDNTAPDSAAVTAPVAGADLSGTIALAATAHDATAGIDNARTTFQIQATGDSTWSDVTGNHFVTTTKPDGPAQVRVAVWDLAGNGPLYSAPVSFVIDNTSPTVAVGVPATVAGTASVSATGSADIATVEFAVSPHGAGTWTTLGTASSSPFGVTWSTGSLADGLYDVRATATDGGGNTGTDVKTVRVDNTAPTATLTQPAGGSTVGGAHVALAATAADGGSGVASVTFQYRLHGSAGAYTDVTTASASPYTGTWDVTGLASGDYDVRALVTDGAGNTATSATSVVTVDSTPPNLTAFVVPSLISGTQSLHVTTSGDTASVTYGVVPSGSGGWTQVGSSSTLPSFTAAFDTTAVADGTYDVRATAVDQFGNAATVTVPNVRIDNTSPTLVSSTPADGAVVASVGSVDATASEPLSAVDSLQLDGTAASFSATVSGTDVSFATGSLADGNHALTGELVDLAGNRYPFRINFTVMSGPQTALPATSKNVSSGVPTTLGTVDSTATVTVPGNVWQQALPSSDDWLVLELQPLDGASLPTTSLQTPSSVVDVHMFWNLAGTEEHHFDAPIEVDLTDPTGGYGIAATLESGAWRRIPALATPGSLPAGQPDGYWRAGGLVHVLTRHLSVFGVLNGLAELQLAPPEDFVGVVAEDGLTLRWSPGIPSEQLQSFTLYSDADGVRLPGTQHEAKLGPITSADTRRFTISETNIAGAESAPSVALRVVPPVAGLAVADAQKALAARTFAVGRTIPTYAPGVPDGTVVGPTDVRVLPEGSTVDLQVATASVVHTPFSFVVASAPRVHATRDGLTGRALVTSRARIDVTLDAYPWKRIQRWHFFHVAPGSTLLPMTLRYPLRPGTYRLFWKATSDVDHSVHRQVTWLTIVPSSRRVHTARVPRVLVVGSTRTTQSFVSSQVRALAVSPEQAYLYGTYHDVGSIVVDVDAQGLGLVHDLHAVFPETAIVALSRHPSRLAAARRAGAVGVPSSLPPAALATLLRALSAR